MYNNNQPQKRSFHGKIVQNDPSQKKPKPEFSVQRGLKAGAWTALICYFIIPAVLIGLLGIIILGAVVSSILF